MEKRVRDLEENARLLQKQSDLLEVLLEKRDVEKSELLENIKDKLGLSWAKLSKQFAS